MSDKLTTLTFRTTFDRKESLEIKAERLGVSTSSFVDSILRTFLAENQRKQSIHGMDLVKAIAKATDEALRDGHIDAKEAVSITSLTGKLTTWASSCPTLKRRAS